VNSDPHFSTRDSSLPELHPDFRDQLFELLTQIQAEQGLRNGRTAAYWMVLGQIESLLKGS